MPFDLVYTSPPFSGRFNQKTAPGERRRGWLDHVASLIEALRPDYVLIESSDLLFALPRRLPAIIARVAAACDRDEPYPEVFVFGSPKDYAAVVHETSAGAMTFDLSKAFAELRVADWSKYVPDHGAVRYRCFEKKAAVKLARSFIGALAEAGALTLEWGSPLKPLSINTGDGGQDGLFHLAGRPVWLQVTGGEKPSILPSAKWPGFAAAHFFLAEGMSSSALKTRSSARRRAIYGKAAPETADIVHFAVGKAAPLASVPAAVRGLALAAQSRGGEAPMRLRTITLHPVQMLDPFAGCGSLGRSWTKDVLARPFVGQQKLPRPPITVGADRLVPSLPGRETEPDPNYQDCLFSPAAFRDEVLARLLDLNRARAAEERALGLSPGKPDDVEEDQDEAA